MHLRRNANAAISRPAPALLAIAGAIPLRACGPSVLRGARASAKKRFRLLRSADGAGAFPGCGEAFGGGRDAGSAGGLRELAKGTPLSVTTLARRLGCERNLLSKHLRTLREARAVELAQNVGGDGRESLYEVPAAYRCEGAGLDYGTVVLRLA